MAKNQTSQLNKMLQTQKWKKFSLSKVYPYMTLSDGTKIVQYDGRKKHSHSTQIKNTPFAFLLDHFSFHNNKDILVKDIKKGEKQTTVVMYNKKRPHSGCVEVRFAERPTNYSGPKLIGWTLVGPQGQRTHIHLSNIETNKHIPEHYFKIVKA